MVAFPLIVLKTAIRSVSLGVVFGDDLGHAMAMNEDYQSQHNRRSKKRKGERVFPLKHSALVSVAWSMGFAAVLSPCLKIIGSSNASSGEDTPQAVAASPEIDDAPPEDESELAAYWAEQVSAYRIYVETPENEPERFQGAPVDEDQHLALHYSTTAETLSDDLTLINELGKLRWVKLVLSDWKDRGCDAVAQATEISGLEFHDSHEVTGAGLQSLSDLKQLRELDIAETGTTAEDFVHVARLENLEVFKAHGSPHWSLQDDQLAHLGGLTKLRALSLGNSRVSSYGFLEELMILEEVQIANMTDEAVPYLLKMKSLQKLDLFLAEVTDRIAPVLVDNPSLEEIKLIRTTNQGKKVFGARTFAAIATAPNLKRIHLDSRFRRSFWLAQIYHAHPNCHIEPELEISLNQVPKIHVDDIFGAAQAGGDVHGGWQSSDEYIDLDRLDLAVDGEGYVVSVDSTGSGSVNRVVLNDDDFGVIATFKHLRSIKVPRSTLSLDGVKQLSVLENLEELEFGSENIGRDQLQDVRALLPGVSVSVLDDEPLRAAGEKTRRVDAGEDGATSTQRTAVRRDDGERKAPAVSADEDDATSSQGAAARREAAKSEKHERAAAALLQKAQRFADRGNEKAGRRLLEEIVEQYPDTQVAEKAQQILKSLP